MRIDRYQPCPCGSGKKIKFCCSADIVEDLGRILRMMDGEQRKGALDAIDKLLAKRPNRPSLLSLKCELQLQLGQVDDAREAAAALTTAMPDSAVGHALTTILHVGDRKVQDAVRSLQLALELTEDEVPIHVYEAIGLVANLLLGTGRVIAARGHYLMQAAIADDDDTSPTNMLVRISQSDSVPLLLKEDQSLARCPETSPAHEEFEKAFELYERGVWLKARDRFKQIADQFPTEFGAVKNTAILETLIGDNAAAIASYHRYAQLEDIPLHDAVEAEALAQLLDPATDRRKFDVLKVTYAVPDVEKMLERLLSERRAASVPFDPSKASSENAPPPKAVFRVLDRPLPESIEGLSCHDCPRVIGEVVLYGKETDREARLELVLVRNDDFQQKLDAFLELAGEALGEAQHERVVSQMSSVTETLTTNWHLPADTNRERYQALMAQEVRDLVLQRWTSRPLAVLDDKTPTEASEDSDARIRLLAAILTLQLIAEQRHWDSVDFNELRSQLGLPADNPIDPDSVDVERLPLVRLTRLMTDKLSDDGLITVYNRAVVKRASNAITRFGLEMVGRDSMDDRIDKAAVYGILAQNAANEEKSLELLEKARSTARAKGRSPAAYLIQELDIQLRQGNAPEARRLIDTIKTQHAKERAIQERLLRLLASYGLVRPDGLPVSKGGPAEDVPVDAAAGEGEAEGLWTPDSAAPADPSVEGESDKPKIWLPGMD